MTERGLSLYRCQDRWLAASLIVLGLELHGVELQTRIGGKQHGAPWVIFVLHDRPERPEWVKQYLARTLQLPVADLRTAYNRLRDVTRRTAPGAARRGEA